MIYTGMPVWRLAVSILGISQLTASLFPAVGLMTKMRFTTGSFPAQRQKYSFYFSRFAAKVQGVGINCYNQDTIIPLGGKFL